MKKLIVIGGATATGKTAYAIKLAQHLGTEILSADSRQFYRGMDIGTAKPTAAELAAAKHHFIDSLDITQAYSVGDFERDALNLLKHIFEKRDYAILVGGSGLFLQAVSQGLDDFPEIPETIRHEVREKEQTLGVAYLQTEVERFDPVTFARIDQQNPARLRRALEVCLSTGKPYSAFLALPKTPRPFVAQHLLLDMPREVLYARINERVDKMVEAGLEEEARHFLPYREKTALKTVGYSEWFEHFDGNCTRSEAIEKIKQHSRNYAKRQITWFKKHAEWQPVDPFQNQLPHLY